MKTIIRFFSITLFGLLIALAGTTLAQNYEAVKTNGSFYFYDSTANDIIAINIDSIAISGNDILYYNFPQIRPTDNSFCYISDGASWLGDPVIEKPEGIFLFKTVDPATGMQTDTLVIKSRANLDEIWKFSDFPYSNDYIEAQVTAVVNKSFLGMVDSVKIISLTRKDASGIVVTDAINGEEIHLSKNYGLIRLPKFDDFNNYIRFYEITGKTDPATGNINPDLNTIFDFEVGDEIHTRYYSNGINSSMTTEIWTIKRVTGKSISPANDWKSYKYDICFLKINKSAPEWIPQYEKGQQSSDDTIFLHSGFAVEMAKKPNQTFIAEGSGWILGTTACLKFQRPAKFLNYNYPFAPSYPEDSCWSMVMVDGGCDPYYVNGLGGPYYDCQPIMYWLFYVHEIVYYRKGSETWGTPLKCDSLTHVGITESPLLQNLKIYPNPTTGTVTLSIPAKVKIPCHLEIFEISGRLLKSITMNQPTQSFDISGFPAGLYNFKLTAPGGDVFRGKIIRQ